MSKVVKKDFAHSHQKKEFEKDEELLRKLLRGDSSSKVKTAGVKSIVRKLKRDHSERDTFDKNKNKK